MPFVGACLRVQTMLLWSWLARQSRERRPGEPACGALNVWGWGGCSPCTAQWDMVC